MAIFNVVCKLMSKKMRLSGITKLGSGEEKAGEEPVPNI